MLLNSIPFCLLFIEMMIRNNTVYLHGKHFEASSYHLQAENYFTLYIVYIQYLFTENLLRVKVSLWFALMESSLFEVLKLCMDLHTC